MHKHALELANVNRGVCVCVFCRKLRAHSGQMVRRRAISLTTPQAHGLLVGRGMASGDKMGTIKRQLGEALAGPKIQKTAWVPVLRLVRRAAEGEKSCSVTKFREAFQLVANWQRIKGDESPFQLSSAIYPQAAHSPSLHETLQAGQPVASIYHNDCAPPPRVSGDLLKITIYIDLRYTLSLGSLFSKYREMGQTI